MKKITIPAKIENLPQAIDFINQQLKPFEPISQAQLQLELAVEEVYVNIAKYAYEPGEGKVFISCEIDENPLQATVQFTDSGIPYNPIDNKAPDMKSREKEVGGLGIFLIKKNVDDISYQYQDGKNILTIRKKLGTNIQ